MAAATTNANLTDWKDGEPVGFLANTNAPNLNKLTYWKDGEPIMFIAPINTNNTQQTDFFLSLGL